MRGAWVLALLWVPLAAWAQSPRVEPAGLAATLAGRVCLDANADGLCSADEPGLADVRLVLATGREVLTDVHGRYHFTALDARTPDATGGLHLRPGRHRVRVDVRSLPPASRVSPEAATVEVPWGAVILQDFAIRSLAGPPPPRVRPSTELPPSAKVVPSGVQFTMTGQAEPGDEVTVEDTPAQVEPDGAWRALVPLKPGRNELRVTVASPSGLVRFFRRPVDLVEHAEGGLVIPGEFEPLGAVRLPGGRETPAATGPTTLRMTVPPGSEVHAPSGVLTAGPEGEVQVPVTLAPGANEVPLVVKPPSGPAREEVLRITAEARPFVVGLLDLEGFYLIGEGFELRGRGAVHGEAWLGSLRLVGELDLRDTDVRQLRHEEGAAWLRPRLPERFEWWLDPDLAIAEWGDDSLGEVPNPAEGRLRFEVRHDTFGRAGIGTYRAIQADGEVGRYYRPLFGPYVELTTGKEGAPRVGLDAFAGSLADPTRRLASVPVHEEFPSTGGSLYYLGTPAVAEGSEWLRVELRDGITGLPLTERHLVRGRDYEIDYGAGRILLAQPLSLIAGMPWLRPGAVLDAPEPVLVADYAAVRTGDARDSLGGEAWAEWGGARVSLSAVRERRDGAPYQLLSAKARGALGPYSLVAEVARSRGVALAEEAYGISDDGGLSFLRPSPEAFSGGGDALTLRLRGPAVGGGSVDAAFRRRSEGYSDSSHLDTVGFRQFSLRAVQPLGPLQLTLLGDDKRAVDPREPFSTAPYAARTVGASLGFEHGSWGVALAVRDARLRASEEPGEGPLLTGGRSSVGVEGQFKVSEWLRLSLGHRQNVSERGEGLGRYDDTFSSAGVDVTVDRDATAGVRGGYGPDLGPQVSGYATWRRGEDLYYGGYSVDVDGPDVGTGRAVMGASTELTSGTLVYVEDVASHDPTSVRVARAVGLRQAVFRNLEVGGRYESGVRQPLDIPSSLTRDVGSVFAQFIDDRVRAEARAELRSEYGIPVRGPPVPVDRTQVVLTLASEVLLRQDLTVSGRLNFSRTAGKEGLEARFLEGYAGAAWRPGPLLLVARYGVTRELPPGLERAFGDRGVQLFSLMPAVQAGGRLTIAAGLHAARSSLGDTVVWTWTGTLRPTLRVVGGLETGVEVARRSASPEGESLTALRAEVAYRVDDRLRVAAGYTLLGFSGLGLPGASREDSDRLYLRAEVAY
ncbi:flagellar motor protein [Myxococcaceae bacterium GXIMD 01537]